MDFRTEIYKRGYSINGFCRKAEIDRTTLWKILNGKTKIPQGYTINQISKALNMSYEDTKELLINGRDFN